MNTNNNISKSSIVPCITSITSDQQRTLDRIIVVIERNFGDSAFQILSKDCYFTDDQKQKIHHNMKKIGIENLRDKFLKCGSHYQQAKYALLLKFEENPTLKQRAKIEAAIDTNFAQIPTDILNQIFALPINPSDTVNFGLTNRRFYHFCTHLPLWNSLVTTKFVLPSSNDETDRYFKLYQAQQTYKLNIKNNHYTFRILRDPLSLLHSQNLHAHKKSVSHLYVNEYHIYSASFDSLKIWEKSGSLIARCDLQYYEGSWVKNILGNGKDRVYVIYESKSNFDILIHHIDNETCTPFKWFSIKQDCVNAVEVIRDFLCIFSKNQVKLWDLDGNLIETMTKQDFYKKQIIINHLNSKIPDPGSVYSYSIPLSCLEIKDNNTNELIQKIDPTDYKGVTVGSWTKTKCYYVFKGCVYLGMSDGQIKIYDFSIPPKQFVFFDFIYSKIL